MKNKRTLRNLNPAMTLVIFTVLTIIISGILALCNFHTNYTTINSITNSYNSELVEVQSLFSLSGLKYIVTHTVNNFVSFAPLSMLIIVLIGIGIMEKTGFLRVFFTMITKRCKKMTLTFFIIFVSMASTLVGDIGYVIMLPLSALLFKYGKRNPWGGIIAAFAAISCTYGVNIFLSSSDSTLLSLTNLGASMVDSSYAINLSFGIFIMITTFIILSVVLTHITEKVVIPKLPRYESSEEDFKVTNTEVKGLLIAFLAGFVYFLIIVYNIIPGLPLSGGLLDHSAEVYIDQIFGENSLFNQGFVFIVTLLFLIIGLVYGLVAKKIKNINDVADSLGHSLDDIGSVIVLIFIASIFISVVKYTNIGLVITGLFANLFTNTTLTGIPLILLLFFGTMLCNLVYTGPALKWSILSPIVVPVFMNASLSPEFAQVVYSFATSSTNGITPLLAYFVIYIAFLNKYRQSENISFTKGVKYMAPYCVATTIVCLVIIIGWYLTGLPIGVGTMPGVTYVS